jgi:hypothetical protein
MLNLKRDSMFYGVLNCDFFFVEFSTPAWSPWLTGDKEVLKKVQEKAVKMVTGLKGSTYTVQKLSS